jgi:hypothetical protein
MINDDFINGDYVRSIQEDLAYLEDYIPFSILSYLDLSFVPLRNKFLKSLGIDKIIGKKLIKEKIGRNKVSNSDDKLFEYDYQLVEDFINKYPEWSNIIKSSDKN